MKNYLLLALLSIISFNSSASYFDGFMQYHIPEVMKEFKGATITERDNCRTGDFTREYDITYYSRNIATLLAEDRFLGEPTYSIDYEYRHPSMLTVEDLIREQTNMGKFAFIHTEANIRQMHRYYMNCNVHEYMFNDKVMNSEPWPVAFLYGMVESGSGNSTIARLANNDFGIKCFDHSRETHLRWAHAAKGRPRLAITAQNDTTCLWVGKDDHFHDHYKYFSSEREARLYRSNMIMTKPRYTWFSHLPFNYDRLAFTVRMYGAEVDAPIKWRKGRRYIKVRNVWKPMKKIYYYGQELQHGDTIWCTNIDAWFIGMNASGYATDPYYADTGAQRFFAMFGDWDEADFKRAEDYMLGLHYQSSFVLGRISS